MSAWLQSLSERERRLVVGGGVVALVLFLLGVVLPLDHAIAQGQARVAHKQADLAWMRSVAPQLAAAAPAVAPPSSQRSLIAVIDASAHEAGLGSTLTNSEPNGPGGLRVRLDKAPFDTMIGWLARLAEQRGIRVETATVDAAGAPGLVNAGIVLRSAP